MSNQPVRRPRHLLDPSNPQPRRADPMSLSQVQTWVLSSLATTTILHLSVGFVIAACHVDAGRTDAQIGLLVIAAAFGMIAVAVGFLIHRASLASWRTAPFLLLGWLPSLVGAWLLFAR